MLCTRNAFVDNSLQQQLQTDQLLRECFVSDRRYRVPPRVHLNVAAISPTQVRKRLRERRNARLIHGIVFVTPYEHADAPHALRLLRPRSERPSGCAA